MQSKISVGINGDSSKANKAIATTNNRLRTMLGLARTVQTELYRITANTAKLGRAANSTIANANEQLKSIKELTGIANAAMKQMAEVTAGISSPMENVSDGADAIGDVSEAAADGASALEEFGDAAEAGASDLGDVGVGAGKASSFIQSLRERLTGAADGMVGFARNVSDKVGGAFGKFGQLLDYATDRTEHAETRFQKLTKSITRIAFYRVVRDLIKTIGNAYKEGIQNLVQYSALMNSMDASEANRTMSEFASIGLWIKDTIGSAVMPMLQALLPLVSAVADVFIFATNAVNQFIKALQGSATWTRALKYPVDYAESLNGVGRAAKEAKKQIFGFDELNIFNAPTNGGGGRANALDYSSLFEENEVSNGFAKIGDTIRNNLEKIENIVGDFALAAGILLMFGGKWELGMGAFIAGAAMKFKAANINWDTLGTTVGGKLGNLIAFTAPVLLSLGVILALAVPSKLPLALGLIVAGISATGISGVSGVIDQLTPEMRNKLDKLVIFTSAVALALGVILAFTNPAELPLAIGLIAAGATSLVTHATLNWTSFSSDVHDRLMLLGVAVGGFTLALGLILAFTAPTKLPLAIGLIAAGAATLGVSAISINWENVPNSIKSKIDDITKMLSVALFAVGAILFFGAQNPKGLSMMIAGAPGTAAALFDIVKWIGEKLTEVKNKMLEWIGEQYQMWVDTGGDWVDAVLAGIKASWHLLTDWLFRNPLKVESVTKMSTNYGGSYGISGNADGGFVDSGQMFVARENGIPEFVGSWGNQTAVANNNQIVEGIAAGVERAMSNTNSAIYSMAASVVGAINDKEIHTQVISDRDIYQSAERGRTLSGRTVYAR